MTDHDWVRRLLADAGQADEPVPPEVAARLDRVVAELSAERRVGENAEPSGAPPAADAPARVVPMTPRRHRRWGAALLAAAALTLGGYTLTATGALDQLGGGASADDAAAGSAAEDSADASQGSAAGGQGGAESAPQANSGADLPELSSATLERDAATLVGSLPQLTMDKAQGYAQGDAQLEPDAARQGSAGDALRDTRSLRELRDCVPPPARGTAVPVRLDGEPATAVVRPRDASDSVVQVWSCRSPVRLATTVVPSTGR